jgi:hypothetical protein
VALDRFQKQNDVLDPDAETPDRNDRRFGTIAPILSPRTCLLADATRSTVDCFPIVMMPATFLMATFAYDHLPIPS